MRQQTSKAIILRRTNYGEADRIVTFLTPAGKIKAMVKGVRRSKSKLAGGIELFSESTITFLQTRGDLQRIVSTRLETHWDGIVGDLQRMMFGYEAMKYIDAALEDEAELGYYELLRSTLAALHQVDLPLAGVAAWFYIRFLGLLGFEPNLKTDGQGARLPEQSLYDFSIDDMCFSPHTQGRFRQDHIKLLRFMLVQPAPAVAHVKNGVQLSGPLAELLHQIVRQKV